MPAKVRVYRAHNHGPRLAQALILGVLLGVVTKLVDPIIGLNFPNVRTRIPLFLLQCLGALLVLALLQRHCRHQVWVFLTGTAVVLSSSLATAAFPMPGYQTLWGETRATLFAQIALSLLMAVILGGVLNLALNYVKDALWGRPLVQDGTMCPKCAYCISHLPQNRCPECGATFEVDQLTPNPPHLFAEWKRLGLQWALLGFGGMLLYAAYPRALFRAPMPWGTEWVYAEYFALRSVYSRSMLLEFLQRGDQEERSKAVRLLRALLRYLVIPDDSASASGQIALDRHAADVIKSAALRDPDPIVRTFATWLLVEFDQSGFYEILNAVLRNSDPRRRCELLFTAVYTDYTRGVPFLIGALTDPDEGVRGYAHDRLIYFTHQAFPFDADAALDDRLAAQAVWQAWWDAQQNQP